MMERHPRTMKITNHYPLPSRGRIEVGVDKHVPPHPRPLPPGERVIKGLFSEQSRIFFSHSLLVFLRSRASTRRGRRREPPGREKMATVGMIFAMFFRCLFISFFSSLVHLSSVFRVFIRSCISPLIKRTSMRMASLLIMISLLRYFLIIGTPATTLFS